MSWLRGLRSWAVTNSNCEFNFEGKSGCSIKPLYSPFFLYEAILTYSMSAKEYSLIHMKGNRAAYCESILEGGVACKK